MEIEVITLIFLVSEATREPPLRDQMTGGVVASEAHSEFEGGEKER